MAISLYDVSVATYLQIIDGVAGFLERTRKHCADNGQDANEFVGGRRSDSLSAGDSARELRGVPPQEPVAR